MTKWITRASVMVLAFAAAGCATDVPQALKPTDIPAKFTSPIPTAVDVWPKKEWWHGFGSTELDGLIADAEKNNLNIAIAFAAVLQAEAQTNAERSTLFPSITLSPSATREQSTLTSGTGRTVSLPGVTGPTFNTFSLTANGVWSPDIWGLAQDNLRAAVQTLKAQRYAQEEVALTEVSDVGTTYLSVLALRDQITIAVNNVEAAKRVLVVTQERLKAGTDSELDLAQEEAVVEGQEANIPVLKEQEHEQLLALAILLGRAPEGFDVAAQNLDGIKSPLVAPGLPSELLLRNPSVAEAEANLASAHANVDAARAAFFPAVSLTGSAGSESSVVGTLFHASTFEWSAGASALQTLFDAGKLFAESDISKAEQLSLVASYRLAVISAFSSVETALGQVSNYAKEQEALEREVKSAANAFRISELQYREGIVDITTVITTEQTLFAAETSLAQAKLAHAQAVVALYESMGGGWSEDPKDQTQYLPGTIPDAPTAPVPNPQDSIWRALWPNSWSD
ncbi:MAG TPA: TolC family protein [Rhizomicrobium sp.]|nr:TolC family protein [Rhizomicrobium sp.]